MQYYYRIKHIPSGRIYVGCQYNKNADPSLFFVTYFTSSRNVKKLITEDGIGSFVIQTIRICKDARHYENRILRYWYNRLGRCKFMNVFINRNVAPGILNDDDSINRANGAVKRQKMSDLAKARLMDGTHNFITHRRVPSPEDISRLVARSIGNNWGSLRQITDEYRANAAEKSRGNTNVRGKYWWNNGVTMKRGVECPGDGWVRGALPHSEETKQKRADSIRQSKAKDSKP